MRTLIPIIALSLIVCLSLRIFAEDQAAKNATWRIEQPASDSLNISLNGNLTTNNSSERTHGSLDGDNRQYFKKINNYLIDHLEQDDPEKNMQLLIDWLERNLKKAVPGWVDQGLIGSAGNLTLLANTSMCDYSNLRTLIAIDNGTDGRAKKQPWYNPDSIIRRRIDKLVFHYITKQAKACQSSYPASLEKKYGQLNQNTVQRIENFTNIIIDSYFYTPNASKDSNLVYTAIRGKGGIRDENLLRNVLLLYTRGDPDRVYLNSTVDEREGKKVVNNAKLDELYSRHLLKPCEYYVSELNSVFEPAQFYSGWYHQLDESVHHFYITWFRYNQCKYNIIERKSWSLEFLSESVLSNPTN